MKIYYFDQQSDEWFAVRLGKLTASHAQTIATNGRGLETLAYQKVAEILTQKIDQSYTNQDLQRGNELEQLARTAYELETGNMVEQVGFVELDEFVGASPDGLVGEKGLVEIKCPRDYNFVKLLHTKKIDPKYMWQMHMQMYVTGREWCDFVAFHENFDKLFIQRVKRDEKAITTLQKGISRGVELIKDILKEVK